MKILQINASYKPAFVYGGPTMSVSKLCEQLVIAGHEITVFTTTANGPAEVDVITNHPVLVDGVPVTYFKRITKDHSHFSPKLLRSVWRNVRLHDVIHIHAWWNLVSVLSCLIAVMRKVPVLVSPRGTLSSYSFTNKSALSKKILHVTLGARILARAHIHTTSKAERDAVLGLIKPKSVSVIPNFVKLEIKPALGTDETSGIFKLLFFSRIEHKKGLDILIAALPMLMIPYTLTIAGDGNEAYINHLKKLAIENGSANRINWIGFQQEHKFDVLGNHQLMVLPSYDENFGNVVIESLSTGTPVLITDGVGLRDYVSENKLGWICKANPASVSSAIDDIFFHQQAERQWIRKNAPSIIVNDFNEKQLTQKYVSMYRQVIQQTKA